MLLPDASGHGIAVGRTIGHHGPMARLSPELRAALEPLVADLRRGLRELDAADVPAPLRRVVAATGRRLPPPLVASLVGEVEANEVLRSRLLEKLNPDEGSPVHRMLVLAPGWWMPLADDAAHAAVENVPTVDTTVVDKLKRQLAEAKRRTADERRTRKRLETELRAVKDEKQSLETAVRGIDDEETVALSHRIAELTDELDAESEGRRLAEERIVELMRRRPRPATSEEGRDRTPARRRVVGAMDDPVEAGRRLDLLMATLAANRQPGPVDRTPSTDNGDAGPGDGGPSRTAPEPLRFPGGLRPDSEAAINWLLSIDHPVTVLVDGYNITFLLDRAAFATGPLRKRLVAELRKLRRQAGGAHRFTVVFDSHHAAAESEIREGGIEVRFTTDEMTADDEIVDLVGQLHGHPVVVISNDRELRERAEARGALAIWGTPLAARFSGS